MVGNTDLDHHEDLDTEASMSAKEFHYLLTAAEPVSRPRHHARRHYVQLLRHTPGHRLRQNKGPFERKTQPCRMGRPGAGHGERWQAHHLPADCPGRSQCRRGQPGRVERQGILRRRLCRRRHRPPKISPPPTGSGPAPHRSLWPSRQSPARFCEERRARKIPGTEFCLAECRWAARMESVVHLDDLLLRRTRLGSLLAGGGESILGHWNRSAVRKWAGTRNVGSQVVPLPGIWKKHYYLPE